MSRKREQLLGYLLGALDPAEREAVEHDLLLYPELRDELEQLRQLLEPLEEGREEYEPPGDLAARTCELVAAAEDARVPAPSGPAPGLPAPSMPVESVVGWQSASMLDMVVASGVCLALSLLFFPALLTSRETSRRLACQDNLRQLGLALATYSENYETIPAIPAQGNGAFAGYYAVSLRQTELLDEDSVVLCPGISNPAQVERFRIPSPAELMATHGAALRSLQRSVGGTYGYNIGYWEQGYRTPRLDGRAHLLVMTDAPDVRQPEPVSINHGGRGMNALFGDLRVVFVRGCTVPTPRGVEADHAFLNHDGQVALGVEESDTVIGRSETPPRPHSRALR